MCFVFRANSCIQAYINVMPKMIAYDFMLSKLRKSENWIKYSKSNISSSFLDRMALFKCQ